MRKWLLVLGLILTARGAPAQTPLPRDTTRLVQQINVADYGAIPLGNVYGPDQTPAMQAAFDAACAVTAGGLQARPIVFIPAGRYALKSGGLTVKCSGLTIRGAGTLATELCFTLPATSTMLTVGTAAGVTNDIFEDFSIVGFCGRSNPQGVDVTCNRCQFNRMNVVGYSSFAFRFLGTAAAGTGGFSIVTHSVIQIGAPNSFAIVIVTQTGGQGGPDANAFVDNFINTNAGGGTGGWVNDSTVAGATAMRSSQLFIGNKFNSVNPGQVIAFKGNRARDRIIGNRFEESGGGGITIAMASAITGDRPATFINNSWVCGVAQCTWTDPTGLTTRIGDEVGATGPQPPGVLAPCTSTTATTSGTGSPVTLKSCRVLANTVTPAGGLLLHIRVWGHTANNGNAKTASVVFGGVTLITIRETASAVDQWSCDLIVGWRANGASPQSVGGECSQGVNTMATPISATPTFSFGVDQTLAVRVTQVAAADMVQDGMFVEVIP